ncbi:aldo/keto reductase [Kutzneria sp. CA-103260]|uniref:aldo/keto reductase n=1 Tax=Kutzneria sp. CA-103260 TaxID=2802641 RepID=UPI001BA90000|nr:aldo/keto reductase [Kutzneria sp. CA-103260]QUQ67350.1 aldo/keto reductase [Kutzneria sp. CA-103260]
MRQLGSLSVSSIGLGCAGMSDSRGAAGEADSVATIRAAIDAGVTLLDTADFYGMGHNEMLIGRALRPEDREKVALSLKFGALRGPDEHFHGVDCRPVAVKNFLAYSLQRLGTDYIDLYFPARLDNSVPIEETVGALAELVEAGHVRAIGLSEVGSETIRRAHAVHPIASVQLEYSLFSRGIERDILTTCQELGIGVTAYGVLAHGLLTGAWQGHGPAHLPWFAAGNIAQNLALVEQLRRVADDRGVAVAQLAIAWVLAQPNVVALVGAKRPGRIQEALPAADIVLSDDDLAAIERAVPHDAVAGERYAPALMSLLDSER